MGLEPLFDKCPVLPVDASISLARYLHSIRQTLQQAKRSENTGDLERAALLQIRVLQLICKTLPSHPDYALEENRAVVSELRQLANLSLEEIETLSTAVEEAWAGSSKSSSVAKTQRRPKLNKVEVPISLMELFERVAAENTVKGLCTLGVLAGRHRSDESNTNGGSAAAPNGAGELPVMSVTALIIPSQTSSASRSEMRHEADLFSLLEVKGLASMGWIQLCPNQAQLGLSPSAARTQAGFQIIQAESVAIVVAPRSPGRFRAYTLTDPGGLNYVLACASRDSVPGETVVPSGLSGAGRPVSAPAKHVEIRKDGMPSFKLYDLRPVGAERDAQSSASGKV